MFSESNSKILLFCRNGFACLKLPNAVILRFTIEFKTRPSFQWSGLIYKSARQRFKFDKLRSRSLMRQEQLLSSSFVFLSCFNRGLRNQNDKSRRIPCTDFAKKRSYLKRFVLKQTIKWINDIKVRFSFFKETSRSVPYSCCCFTHRFTHQDIAVSIQKKRTNNKRSEWNKVNEYTERRKWLIEQILVWCNKEIQPLCSVNQHIYLSTSKQEFNLIKHFRFSLHSFFPHPYFFRSSIPFSQALLTVSAYPQQRNLAMFREWLPSGGEGGGGEFHLFN